MIVKNESRIIKRCLDSVLSIIDSYCIIDTGSTDGTQEIIKKELASFPGEIIERPWVNFGHNRQEALDLGRKWGDFLLLVDADMVLKIKRSFKKDSISSEVGAYEVIQVNGNLSYYNNRLINTKLRWKCIGVTHEYYGVDEGYSRETMKDLWFADISDGGSKSDKFERDIALLTKGLIDDPGNERYMFYLAQSYKDTRKFREAIEWYKKRIAKEGWIEEVWYSYYMICQCLVELGKLEEAEKWAMAGYKIYPSRSEALYLMCKTYRIKSMHQKAYAFYKLGSKIPYPSRDRLFIQAEVYYQKLFEYEYTILHYYLFPEKRIDGLRSSVMYINQLGNTGSNVHENIKFYAPILCQEGALIEPLALSPIGEYVASSPCSIITQSGEEVTNVRFVNYCIDRASGAYHYTSSDLNSTLKEKSVFVVSTINYNLRGKVMEVMSNTYHNKSSDVQGLEDIRLFEKKDGSILFTSTGKDHSDEGKIQMCTGRYDHSGGKIYVDRVLTSPYQRNCEKNWVLLNEEEFIYEWFPLSIHSMHNSKKIRSYETPAIFKNFRGSSNSITDGSLKYFLVHSVNYEIPRKYLHYIVATDLDGKPVYYTLPFSFEGEKIEYCLSMNIIGENFVFYYSVWDSSPKILSIEKNYFIDKIVLA